MKKILVTIIIFIFIVPQSAFCLRPMAALHSNGLALDVSSSSTVSVPFPNLKERTRFKADKLLIMLRHKCTVRTLLRDGPIAQPEFFIALRRDRNAMDRMRRVLGCQIYDMSYYPSFTNPSDVKSFDSAIKDLLSGRLPLPIIFKPNHGAQGQGEGIFFLEKGPAGDIIITLAFCEPYNFSCSREVESYLRKTVPTHRIKKTKKEHIMQIILKPKRDDVIRILHSIWNIMATRSAEDSIYDAGMIEQMLTVIKYKGKSYETRHAVKGNLSTGACQLKKPTFEKLGSHVGHTFARVGSSAYFSNYSRRFGAYELGPEEMFDPLYKLLNIPAKRRKEFEAYSDDLIRREFQYLAARLKAAGINIEARMALEFDLMWQAPIKKGDFPTPVLVEITNATGIGPDDWDKEIILSRRDVLQGTTLPVRQAGLQQKIPAAIAQAA